MSETMTMATFNDRLVVEPKKRRSRVTKLQASIGKKKRKSTKKKPAPNPKRRGRFDA